MLHLLGGMEEDGESSDTVDKRRQLTSVNDVAAQFKKVNVLLAGHLCQSCLSRDVGPESSGFEPSELGYDFLTRVHSRTHQLTQLIASPNYKPPTPDTKMLFTPPMGYLGAPPKGSPQGGGMSPLRPSAAGGIPDIPSASDNAENDRPATGQPQERIRELPPASPLVLSMSSKDGTPSELLEEVSTQWTEFAGYEDAADAVESGVSLHSVSEGPAQDVCQRKSRQYRCDYNCGFKGSYELVLQHEAVCTSAPATRNATGPASNERGLPDGNTRETGVATVHPALDSLHRLAPRI